MYCTGHEHGLLHRFAADVRRFEEHLQHEGGLRLQTMIGTLQYRSFTN